MLSGKTAVVTGGSRGIGAETARTLAAAGADVAVVCAGSADLAEAVCAECRRLGVRARSYLCDVSDFAATKELVSQIKKDFGTVDILVNNAGITRDNLLAMMSEQQFDEVMDTNLKGAFNMMRHCAGIFIRKRSGCIVNVSSVAGIAGNPGQCNYSASKAGIIGLTKSAARELASRGVTCNAVAPGFIDTDMTRALPADRDELEKAIPLGRIGTPGDVAKAVLFLAEAGYVTGEVLRVDGGVGM
ncbi:MAG: 3-oxoacyl-[Oscillospiraceae bacterium]|nr:3-oxoacyl-[acyl-carrier-protein] reductase [Oscillospiraceae bacterium]